MLMPLMASAATKINGIYYYLNSTNKVASVTCRYEVKDPDLPYIYPISSYSGDVIIPQTVEFNGVTYTVTSIESNAFYGCTNLSSVVIPNSVKTIGGSENGAISLTLGAFQESSLTSVNIPNSVTFIGPDAFRDCTDLTTVYVTDITAWCNISFSNTYSNPLTYAHHLFLNGEEVKDLVIPNSVTTIGKNAFYHCTGITSVTAGNGTTSINNNAFQGCSSLSLISHQQ